MIVNLDSGRKTDSKDRNRGEVLACFPYMHLGVNEILCRNKESDFSKGIRFWKSGSKLHAAIAAGEMEILFQFSARE